MSIVSKNLLRLKTKQVSPCMLKGATKLITRLPTYSVVREGQQVRFMQQSKAESQRKKFNRK